MPNNTNERLEHEARESLVAADLSAKMKQWRGQSSPPGAGNGRSPIVPILFLLLALGGTAWWLWPTAEKSNTVPPKERSVELPGNPPNQQPSAPKSPQKEPIAQKTAPSGSRYLALAQSNYRAPDFASDIRSGAPASADALNDARRALAERRFSDALLALQNVPADYISDAAYLRGHALFGLKKHALAAAAFSQLTESVRYGEAAQWYEVLSLLPDLVQQKPLILKSLEKMATDEKHMFHREAKQLAREIY